MTLGSSLEWGPAKLSLITKHPDQRHRTQLLHQKLLSCLHRQRVCRYALKVRCYLCIDRLLFAFLVVEQPQRTAQTPVTEETLVGGDSITPDTLKFSPVVQFKAG